ncbi:MAG: RNA polymerase sigma factor [Streptosporangiaceae bacterium]
MAGDEDQRERRFRRLYEANFRPVQAYAVNRLARSDDVADVVAEVFMIAWRRLADVPPPPHDRFWLYGTARRVIAKRYRSASRRHNLLGRLAAERPEAAEWADNSARERLRTLLGAESQADRPVPVAIKPNGVTDGS